jgi:TRAP-type C4-dicarboxylate transport system permease large subunit
MNPNARRGQAPVKSVGHTRRYLGPPVPGLFAVRPARRRVHTIGRSAPSPSSTRSFGIAIHRKLDGRGFAEALRGSLSNIGSVMSLIALSAIFSYGIVLERIPEVVSGWITGLTSDLNGVMVLITVFVVVAGFFIDATVLIIMLTPILLPLVRELGGDPVHFALVFIVAATIGNFTPPVGAAMYAVCSIMRCPIEDYTRESLPLFVAVAVVTLLLIWLPGAVLWLPNLIFGG